MQGPIQPIRAGLGRQSVDYAIEAIAGIAQTRHDVALVVELFIDGA